MQQPGRGASIQGLRDRSAIPQRQRPEKLPLRQAARGGTQGTEGPDWSAREEGYTYSPGAGGLSECDSCGVEDLVLWKLELN